jgi:TRAP-type mannitol/chloroaromatic compound transport system substrate-binding protein
MSDNMKAEDRPEPQVKRRDFLTGAAGIAVAGVAIAAPNVARAQAITLKFQSTWPNKDIFHEYATDFVNRVNAVGEGKVKIELLQAGAVVPAFGVLDAVNTGVLDGGHGVAAYWYGKNKAFSLFGTAPPFGWRANQYLGWLNYGGGQALYNELLQDIMKVNIVGFQSGPMPTQPLGWFKNEIKTPEDLKGIKYRTVGLAADLFKELGTAVTILPGGEIVPALDRGLIDGAEFNNPSSDRVLGFADVSKNYMVQSYHQALEAFEILFNKTKYDSLPKEVQSMIKVSAESASADMSWKQQERYSKDLQALKDAGVKVIKTPKSVLEAQLAAWDKVIASASADPFFKKVIDSQKAWAQRVVGLQFETEVDQQMAYEHFFGKA